MLFIRLIAEDPTVACAFPDIRFYIISINRLIEREKIQAKGCLLIIIQNVVSPVAAGKKV